MLAADVVCRASAGWPRPIGPRERALGELARRESSRTRFRDLEYRVEQHGAMGKVRVFFERLCGQRAAERMADHEVPPRSRSPT